MATGNDFAMDGGKGNPLKSFMEQNPSQSLEESRTDRSKSVTFWIREVDHARLKEFAREHGLSVSNVINRALKRLLDDTEPFNRKSV